MPAGLQVINNFGTVSIDENWQNYGLIQKTQAAITAYGTSPPNPAGYNGMLYQMSVAGTESLLIACKASVLLPVMLHSYFDGSTWTFNWLFLPPLVATYSETVEFYIFDVLPVTGFSNFGFEVFNAAGKRVFHSDCNPMRVAAIQGCDAAFTGVSGRSYVPLIARNPIFGDFVSPVGFRAHSYCLRVSGSNIITDYRQLGGGCGASGSYSNIGAFAAIDVTGF
jgi:hypothetical protein